MDIATPTTLTEAIAALAARPDAVVVAGGTDAMVAVNAGWMPVPALISLRRLAELRTWSEDAGRVRLGAGLTYADLMAPDLAALVPGLAQAARTVGSPPIRNAGTIGGNLATASPAGDTLPVFAALDAEVELAGPGGSRTLPLAGFVTGPKQNALLPGELVVAVTVPVVAGAQEYRKVGVRNAMVIAVASVALVADRDRRRITCALGSVGPVPIRATEAEDWVRDRIDWDAGGLADPTDAARFGGLVADAARPIDDHRSTAAYRTHAVGVLAGRCLSAALSGSAAAA
jgi:CO/xanthine dehydrogenase FAD-binding subunit